MIYYCLSCWRKFNSYTDIIIANPELQKLGLCLAYNLWAGRDLYCAISALTQVYLVTSNGLPRLVTSYNSPGLLRTNPFRTYSYPEPQGLLIAREKSRENLICFRRNEEFSKNIGFVNWNVINIQSVGTYEMFHIYI